MFDYHMGEGDEDDDDDYDDDIHNDKEDDDVTTTTTTTTTMSKRQLIAWFIWTSEGHPGPRRHACTLHVLCTHSAGYE